MRKHPFIAGFIFLCGIFGVFVLLVWVYTHFELQGNFVWGEKNKIGVVEVEGVLTKSRPVIERILKFKKNESIKAIILRINSPGGGVGPAQEIYEELMKLRDKKYIVASMESIAASGGYYIACAAHKIVANPGTITGSIGVIVEFANIEELLKKVGLKSIVIKSGKYKDIMSPTREMSKEERELLQSVIDNVHNQFIEAVAKGRNISKERIQSIADGRIFSGEQAKSLGLVDVLGNFQDAIDIAAELAGIKGEPHVIYPEKRRPSIWEFLIGETLLRIRETIEKYCFNHYFRFRYLWQL